MSSEVYQIKSGQGEIVGRLKRTEWGYCRQHFWPWGLEGLKKTLAKGWHIRCLI